MSTQTVKERLGGADWVLWAALGFVLVGTAHAEYTLAVDSGWNKLVAATVPGCLDLYVIRALQKHRDVFSAVVLMVGVNVLAHLVAAGDVPMHWWIKSVIGGLGPVLLWRIHHLWRALPVPTPVHDSGTVSVPEVHTVPAPVPDTDTRDWDVAWAAEWESMTCTPGADPVSADPCDGVAGVHAADTVRPNVLTLPLPAGFTADTDEHGVLLEGDWAAVGTVRAYVDTCTEQGTRPSIRGLKEFAGCSTDKARRLLTFAGVIEPKAKEVP